ncbi:MAG TPA: DUF2203 domain-containing protein, partial [Verrucomicrobiae bacterium]|nr:DUF2203 domain-containing protein [Verrucomicrobiae bacterium]
WLIKSRFGFNDQRMSQKFHKHYSREEARALLPQLRKWLEQLASLNVEFEKNERRLAGLLASGQDTGGSLVNTSVKLQGEIRWLFREFQEREIFIKDLDRGLIDFPAIVGGKEVFLCWEKDEDDIEYWHDIDSGFASREPL